MVKEHIIPHDLAESAFQGAMLGSIASEYENLTTIMVYKGAADLKTGGRGGDTSLLARFRNITGGNPRRRTQTGRELPPSRIMDSPENMMKAYRMLAQGAVVRTAQAVQQEGGQILVPGATNAQRRGPQGGTPEAATPTEAQIGAAANVEAAELAALWVARQQQVVGDLPPENAP
jgi:hypothetical protein